MTRHTVCHYILFSNVNTHTVSLVQKSASDRSPFELNINACQYKHHTFFWVFHMQQKYETIPKKKEKREKTGKKRSAKTEKKRVPDLG